MDLPEHYLPGRVCPHIGEGEHNRLMFAECGSYDNVNLSIRDEGQSIQFWPQKGQGSVKNLTTNIPSLPLFNYPLNDKWREWDTILGMKNYNEMLNDLTSLTMIVKTDRGLIKNYPKNKFTKNIRACSKIVLDFYHNGHHDLTQLPDKEYREVMETLDNGLNRTYAKYEKAADACAYGTNCLQGYNRDFYGGLLSVVMADSNKSADVLIHAGGSSFQDIFITEASSKQDSRLRQARLLDKISLDEPVYQIISSSMCKDKGLLCARQKHKCLLMHSKGADHKLMQIDGIDFPHELLTSVNFSPYINNELLVSTKTGSIYLWNINTRSKDRLLVKTQDSNCKDRWSCSYFGGHPRHIVVADTTSMAMFDHRSHFTDGIDLFSLSPSLTKKEEHIMAATSLGFPFHAVVTDYAVFIIDQRFPLAPVLQWSTELISSPQYIQVLHQQNSQAEQEKLLFVASQQPPEVMCFPLTTHRDHSPTSPVIPWRLSQIGDFCQSTHTSYPCDLMKTERRFQASLAGIAVSNQSTESGFTVYQIDCYGDIFYQSLVHKLEDPYNLQSCTKEDRQAADEQAESWLKAFENLEKNEASQLESVSVTLAPNILNDIFGHASSKTTSEHNQDCPKFNKRLHRNLKTLKQLPSKGSSARLHLALRDKTDDIMEILTKREKDHTAMKKRMRKLNLKMLKGKKKNLANKTRKQYKKRKNVSSYFCRSDTTDDDDDDVGRGKTTTKNTNRSTNVQDGCDKTLVTGTSTLEDFGTISDSSLESLHSGAQRQMMETNNNCVNRDISIELLQNSASPKHIRPQREKTVHRKANQSSLSSCSMSSLSDTDGSEFS